MKKKKPRDKYMHHKFYVHGNFGSTKEKYQPVTNYSDSDPHIHIPLDLGPYWQMEGREKIKSETKCFRKMLRIFNCTWNAFWLEQ